MSWGVFPQEIPLFTSRRLSMVLNQMPYPISILLLVQLSAGHEHHAVWRSHHESSFAQNQSYCHMTSVSCHDKVGRVLCNIYVCCCFTGQSCFQVLNEVYPILEQLIVLVYTAGCNTSNFNQLALEHSW